MVASENLNEHDDDDDDYQPNSTIVPPAKSIPSYDRGAYSVEW